MQKLAILNKAIQAQELLIKIASETKEENVKRRFLKQAIRVGKLARGSTMETND